MKRKYFVVLLFITFLGFGQEAKEVKKYTLDASQFYGTVLLHSPDIAHLINSHPTGLIVGLNRKTYGSKAWEGLYNYPDYGFSFIYQDMRNETLGENFGLYAHYNFYFFKRNIQFRL